MSVSILGKLKPGESWSTVYAADLKEGEIIVANTGRELLIEEIKEVITDQRTKHYHLKLNENGNIIWHSTKEDESSNPGVKPAYNVIRGRKRLKKKESNIELVNTETLKKGNQQWLLLDQELVKWCKAKNRRPHNLRPHNLAQSDRADAHTIWRPEGSLSFNNDIDKADLPLPLFFLCNDQGPQFDGTYKTTQHRNAIFNIKKIWEDNAKVFATEQDAWLALEAAWAQLPDEIKQLCWQWEPK